MERKSSIDEIYLILVELWNAMETSVDNCYRVIRIACSIIGIWPYQKGKSIVIRRALLILILTQAALSQLAMFFTSHFDTGIIFEMLTVHVVTVVLLLSLINYYYHESRHKALWDHIKLNWITVEDKKEHEIQKTFNNITRKLVYFMYWAYFIGTTTFVTVTSNFTAVLDILFPLNESRPYQFPFAVEYFFEKEKHILLVLFIMQTSTMIIVFIGFTFQITLWVQLIHLIGLLRLTGYGLNRVLFNEDKLKSSMQYHRSIIVCIQRHQHILRFRRLIQCNWNFIISLTIMSIVITISTSLIKFSISEEFDSKPLWQLLLIILLVLCDGVIIQNTMDEAKDLVTKVYFSDWYSASPNLRKLLIMIMQQAQQPFTFTGFKIFVVSVKSLRDITRIAISYYTVIMKMQ